MFEIWLEKSTNSGLNIEKIDAKRKLNEQMDVYIDDKQTDV